MVEPLVLSVEDARLGFGGVLLFEDLSFYIHERDKICLVGKNGAGKTTLMNIIKGIVHLDEGSRWLLPGTTIGYMQQDVVPKVGQTVFEYVFEELQGEEDYIREYKVEQVLQPLEIDPQARMDKLSGGQIRRAALARALVEEPDILLLDEPTNHLDLGVIEWLENYLKAYRGALLCISHDRMFLARISDKIFWLDRGHIRVCPRGFGHFEEWSTMLLEQEERELQNRKKQVEMESEWASKGVKARRKRNQRRLELLKEERAKLKADMSSYRRVVSKIELEPPEPELTSKIVAEFFRVCKTFHDDKSGKETVILDRFNMRIIRGDRIGIIGRNGSGKTSFLRLLLGELKPDMGKIKLNKELEFAYFDQKRAALNPEDTLWKTLCPGGGDYLDVMGKTRHVCGYLKDFLFDPAYAHKKVSVLSGGQKNRLMLAKVLANPGSFLILDEPTNDLDMDTLDMLEDIIAGYKGTLIVVSHDRDFLDRTVTKILSFEGGGNVEGYIGGYSDYIEVKKREGKEESPAPVEEKKKKPQEEVKKSAPVQKLSYKVKYELEQLPEKMAALEHEMSELEKKLAEPDFYNRDKDSWHEASERFEKVKAELDKAETRWLELEAEREAAEG